MGKLINRTTTHVVRGAETDGTKIRSADIVVRISADKFGKSISLSNDTDKMLIIPLEPIIHRLKEILDE